MRRPLWLGFSATAASVLYVVSGLIGYNLSKHDRFVAGSVWKDGVIWWEVLVGLALVPVAILLLRRGARDVERTLTHS